MGCDIHIYVEKKNELGEWEIIKGRNPRIDNYREYAKMAHERGELDRAASLQAEAKAIESGEAFQAGLVELQKEYPKETLEANPNLIYDYESELAYLEYHAPKRAENWIYDGRNYGLFAILANVRNGYGFAGVDTGDGFVPIKMPKGLPTNVSFFVEEEARRWGIDGHSHSYLTAKELSDYDWFQLSVKRGVVNEKQYKVFLEKGIPDSYSGDSWGNNIIHLTNSEMDALLNGTFPREEGKSYHTKVSWKETYQEASGYFYSQTLPALKELAQDKPEDVRIVFWFDN